MESNRYGLSNKKESNRHEISKKKSNYNPEYKLYKNNCPFGDNPEANVEIVLEWQDQQYVNTAKMNRMIRYTRETIKAEKKKAKIREEDAFGTRALWSLNDGVVIRQSEDVRDCYVLAWLYSVLTKCPKKAREIMYVDTKGRIIIQLRGTMGPVNQLRLWDNHDTYYDHDANQIIIPKEAIETFKGEAETNVLAIGILENITAYLHELDIQRYLKKGDTVLKYDKDYCIVSKEKRALREDALNFLTSVFNFKAEEVSVDALINNKEYYNKQPVYVSMKLYNDNGIELGRHAYSLKSITIDDNGNPVVSLANPHNTKGKQEESLASLEYKGAHFYLFRFS